MDENTCMKSIEDRIVAIEQRNQRVESEKAWETSWVRIGIITIGTYIAATILLWIIEVPNPYLGSLVPALGFWLSTQSLPALKRWWMQQKMGNE